MLLGLSVRSRVICRFTKTSEVGNICALSTNRLVRSVGHLKTRLHSSGIFVAMKTRGLFSIKETICCLSVSQADRSPFDRLSITALGRPLFSGLGYNLNQPLSLRGVGCESTLELTSRISGVVKVLAMHGDLKAYVAASRAPVYRGMTAQGDHIERISNFGERTIITLHVLFL